MGQNGSGSHKLSLSTRGFTGTSLSSSMSLSSSPRVDAVSEPESRLTLNLSSRLHRSVSEDIVKSGSRELIHNFLE